MPAVLLYAIPYVSPFVWQVGETLAQLPAFARVWGPVFRLSRDIAVTAAAIHWY